MIEEEQGKTSQYIGLHIPARSRARRGGSGSFAAGGGDVSPSNSAVGEGMKSMAQRGWGMGKHVTGNKSQATNCKEDLCLGSETCNTEGATTHAGGRRKPGNNKVGEDMTKKRRENKPVKTRSMCLQRILAREGEAPVALLPEGPTRAPVTI